jgi:hypothetical protein
MSPTSESQLAAGSRAKEELPARPYPPNDESTSNASGQSTGPRTPEGKRRSSLNALRHGLTGRVVVLPTEDLTAYQSFSEELFASLKPETPVERQFAQTYIDTQWRLNRIRAIEDGMFALGHFEEAGDIDVDHPEIHSTLTAARKFREDSKAFANLSLYEQRLQRTLKESLRQLHELQTARKVAKAAEAEAQAAAVPPPAKPKPAAHPLSTEFVYSTAETNHPPVIHPIHPSPRVSITL